MALSIHRLLGVGRPERWDSRLVGRGYRRQELPFHGVFWVQKGNQKVYGCLESGNRLGALSDEKYRVPVRRMGRSGRGLELEVQPSMFQVSKGQTRLLARVSS